MKFPYKCSRCGACCLFEMCKIGKLYFKIINTKDIICPALSFSDDGIASCSLVGIVPIGDGCCISARVFKDGREIQFASFHPDLKKEIVKVMRNKPEYKVICSYCKKPMYMKRGNTGNEVSHSICPDCYEKEIMKLGEI